MRGYDYETNGYHREMEDEYEDEYYDQDEYEEEGSGPEEEVVEEEDPPEGQQEFLKLREQMKEQIRRSMKEKGAGASTADRSSSLHDRRMAAKDKFGSFFGPSKPVISQRVIEERKSIKELQNTMSRDPRPSRKDIQLSSKIQAKTNGLYQKPKIVNEAKRKAEALKDNRDYSFLLSDDAISTSKEQSGARSALAQKSDHELIHSAGKSKVSTSQPARLSNGRRLKSTPSSQSHMENKLGSLRKEALPNKEKAISSTNGRMHGVVRNGFNEATSSKTPSHKLPSKAHIANKPPAKGVNGPSLGKNHVASKHHLNERPQSSQSQRLQLSSHSQRPQQFYSQRPQQSVQGQRPQQSSQGQRLQPSQSQRLQSQSYRLQSSQGQRPHLTLQGHHTEQKRLDQAHDRVKTVQKQIRPPSKPMPSRPISSNGHRDDRTKKKHMGKRRSDDEFDGEEDALAMIRSMFRYDPRKYAGRDEDDSDMEADFATIQREEMRSARIARQEDEEELRLIEEEERREQERKRRKLMR